MLEDHEQNLRDLEQRRSQRLQEVEEQAAEELANKLLQLRRSLTNGASKQTGRNGEAIPTGTHQNSGIETERSRSQPIPWKRHWRR
jgi:hypothetical protein